MYYNAIQLTRIQMGGVICMPALLAGYWLEQHYQIGGAILALFLGNIVLWVLSIGMLQLALVKRYTTSECAKQLLGPFGEVACAIAYVIALMGWFAINQYTMIFQVFSLWGVNKQSFFYTIGFVLGLLNIYFIRKGIQKMEFISRITIPVMLCVIGFFWVQSLGTISVSKIEGVFYIAAIIFVINLSLGMVFDIPTYYRYAKNMKEGLISVTLLFWVFVPLVELVGVLMGASHPLGEQTWLQTDSIVLKIVYTIFMLLAGIMTNNANLYSAAANSAKILPFSFKNRVLLLGGAGCILSFFDIWSKFDSILTVMTRGMLIIGAALLLIYLKKGKLAFES